MKEKINSVLNVKKTAIFVTLIFMSLAACSRENAQETRHFLAKDKYGTPYDFIATSRTGHFYLAGDKLNKTMTCFEFDVDENYRKTFTEKWQISGYLPNENSLAWLSNNGEFCAIDNKDEYTEKTFEKKDILFWVYKNGKLYDTITRGKFIKKLEKILGPDAKVSADLEVEVNEIYINGLRLETYYYDKEYDYAGADDDEFVPVNDIYLWYDFDTKNFLNSNKLRADQCKIAFDVLAKKFSDAEKLIEDNDDKAEFRRAFEKIMPFKKDAPTDTTYRWYVKTYADGNFKVQSIVPRDRFEGMEALERFVYYEDETQIDFFILDDVYDFAIRIQKGTEWEIEYRPTQPLIYMFDTKKSIVKIQGDYQEN